MDKYNPRHYIEDGKIKTVIDDKTNDMEKLFDGIPFQTGGYITKESERELRKELEFIKSKEGRIKLFKELILQLKSFRESLNKKGE